jgi:Apolipoprotein N-acyltransferase
MKPIHSTVPQITWKKGALLGLAGITCFHLACSIDSPPARLLSLAYVAFLVQLARLGSRRLAFYMGFGTGLMCVAPQLFWFFNIFGAAAVPLWMVLSLWTALFVLLAHRVLRRFGPVAALVLIPFLWTGLEYFRSELYHLKFSWLNAGYPAATVPQLPVHWIGMYGIGFAGAVIGAVLLCMKRKPALGATGLTTAAAFIANLFASDSIDDRSVRIGGVQLEFPNELQLMQNLNRLAYESPETDLVVLSEYTLDGDVPESLKNWCRTHQKHLIVGGKNPLGNGTFLNTAFVIDPNGEVVFKQAKSVPIQFFADGLPAPEQKVWNSPWGKIGICICYDLSYTRVTDELVKQGAQMLIVPTMDVASWGKHQHELHAMVAPARAKECGIPIFRLASSGISQAVDARGNVVASAGFPGEGEILTAKLRMVIRCASAGSNPRAGSSLDQRHDNHRPHGFIDS